MVNFHKPNKGKTQKELQGAQTEKASKRNIKDAFQAREKSSEWEERVLQVSRVTKVVKGGKNLSFRVLVVIGDGRGTIGVGIGKASEVAEAIKKASEAAKKNTVKLSFDQGSIPHNVWGKSNASKIFLYRAPKGTGLIAGLVIKAAFELAGLHNVVCKIHGSTNPANVLQALMKAVMKLKSRGQIRQQRNFIDRTEEVTVAS